jgi:hypothetical protein
MSPLTVPIQERTEDMHPALHGVGRKQYLRDEQDAVAEVDAYDAHSFNERFVEHLLRGPTAAEQLVGAFGDLVAEAVIEVVMHLRDEVIVV